MTARTLVGKLSAQAFKVPTVFPTTGGVNPSLTITSIALRTADRIRALASRGEL